MIKVLTIIGARPQIIKAATLSRIIKNQYSSKVEEVLVHTGQHYDENMSDVFFKDMDIPKPKYNLGLGGLSQSAMTGRMMEGLEEVCLKEKPDWILVYGDTNSTLAGALVVTQITLGALVIDMKLHALLVSIHLGIGILLFAMVLLTTLFAFRVGKPLLESKT